MNMPDKKKRSPLLAAVLSIAATGAGHIYCGRLAKGLTLFFISFVFAPIIAMSMENTDSHLLGAVVISVVILISVFFYAVIDAYRLAKRTGADYEIREYNRWYIYLLFIIVSISYPSNLSNHIREHILQAYKVPSLSMVPGILKNDYIFLNKTVYKRQSPQRGDVVIFTCPNERHKDFIKRIVAMPGDTLEIKDSILIINGRALTYAPVGKAHLPELPAPLDNLPIREEKNGNARYRIIAGGANLVSVHFEKITVPNGHCFVLGDNRPDSRDSRHFGPVPMADIKGRVDYIYFPARSWSRFGPYGKEL